MFRSLSLTLVLALGLIVTACGGGGDDDADPTPTSAPGQSTPTGAAVTATPVASPPLGTATAAPGGGSGAGSGPGSGTTGTPVLPSGTPTGGGQADATATRRPATVVSTPRPIATRPAQPTTPPVANATPTEIPPTAEDGQLTIVMEEDFEAEESDWFATGTSEFGTTMEIFSGAYVLTPAAESWQTITIGEDDSWHYADGLITADFSIEGNGEFGLVARQTQDDDGVFYFYVCWLAPSGAAGCSIYQGDTFTELFRQDDPALFQPVNTMLMQVIGEEIIFEVNGQQIGAIDDATIAAGYWGFYVYGDANLATSRVDYIAVAVP